MHFGKVLLSCRLETKTDARKKGLTRACESFKRQKQILVVFTFIQIGLNQAQTFLVSLFLIKSVMPACSKHLWSKLKDYWSQTAAEREGEYWVWASFGCYTRGLHRVFEWSGSWYFFHLLFALSVVS